MNHDCKAGVKDGKDGDVDDQVVVSCFSERKTVQHRTVKKNRCASNSCCNESVQTEVARTCGQHTRSQLG